MVYEYLNYGQHIASGDVQRRFLLADGLIENLFNSYLV